MPLFRKSKTQFKKYDVVTPSGRLISFGDTRYQHFKDTALGLFSHLDHNDTTRRKSYLQRASQIRDKNGKLTAKDPESANYYAIRYLW